MPLFIGFVTGNRSTGFTVQIPDAPDVTATGASIDSLSLRATVALREWAYDRRMAGLSIPQPSRLATLDQRGRLVMLVHVSQGRVTD